jgi:putative transposase
MLKIVADEAAREDLAASLDEIVREGARRMLAAALEDEVAAYIATHAGSGTSGGWWCATGMPGCGRSPRPLGRWK